MDHRTTIIGCILFTVLLGAAPYGANAADITLLAANGSRLFVTALVPEFERRTKHSVIAKFEEPGIQRRAVLGDRDRRE